MSNETTSPPPKVDFYRHDAAPTSNPIDGLSIVLQGVIWEILDRYGFTWYDMTGRKRPQDLADCRSLIMAFLAWHSDLSLVEIGLLLGGRDHGTVIHSRRKMANLIEISPKIADFVFDLEERHLDIENPSAVERESRERREGFALPSTARATRNRQKFRAGRPGHREARNSGLLLRKGDRV